MERAAEGEVLHDFGPMTARARTLWNTMKRPRCSSKPTTTVPLTTRSQGWQLTVWILLNFLSLLLDVQCHKVTAFSVSRSTAISIRDRRRPSNAGTDLKLSFGPIDDRSSLNDDDLMNTSSSAAATTATASNLCPFIKYFPKYKIDLSSRRKSVKPTQKSWFSSWIPSISGLSQAKIQSKWLRSGEQLVWLPDLDGINAHSALWKEADRLLSNPSASSVVVALPDATASVVRNWLEVMVWIDSQYPFPSDGTTPRLEAVRLDSNNPDDCAVRIQKSIHNTNSNQLPVHDAALEESIVNRRTMAWVQRILVEQGICPFTKSPRMSGQGLAHVGVPVGSIAYHTSAAKHPVRLLADTWQAIEAMIAAGPEGRLGVSSILLAAPAFDEDFDLWAGPIFAMLEASVIAALAESQIGVVCFHPRYACPDGSSWPGFGHMHSVPRLEKWYQEAKGLVQNEMMEDCPAVHSLSKEDIAAGGAWQRRTPHATINVLRADQLEAAEARRSSGELYPINIDKLVGPDGIGCEKLAQDLERERNMI